MASIDKRNGKWRVQVRRKGVGSVSRSFLNKKDAERWGLDTERAIERGDFDRKPKAAPKEVTLAQLIERYQKEISVRKKGAGREVSVFNAFLRDHSKLADKVLSQVTLSDWTGYRDIRLKKIKPSSLKRQLIVFGHMYEVARTEWGYQIDNPIEKVTLKYVDERRTRRLKDGELDKLLTEARSRKNKIIAPVIEFAVITGMRRSEILNLKWSDLDLKERLLTVRESKNGRSRQLPITSQMRAILEGLEIDRDRVFPVSEANFKSTWKRILEKTGIPDFHFHDCRHEGISSFFEKGLGIQEVASLSGHQSYKMLARYTHPKPHDILKKLEKALV